MSKVILKENIRNLGRVGQVVSVKDGHAFNYLIPQNKAIPATKENLSLIEVEREKLIKEDLEHKKIAQKIAEKLPKILLLARPINENGVLYGVLSAKDIIAEIPSIPNKHAVHFKQQISTYGVYQIELELHHDVILNITVSVSDTKESATAQLEKMNRKNTDEKTTQESAS